MKKELYSMLLNQNNTILSLLTYSLPIWIKKHFLQYPYWMSVIQRLIKQILNKTTKQIVCLHVHINSILCFLLTVLSVGESRRRQEVGEGKKDGEGEARMVSIWLDDQHIHDELYYVPRWMSYVCHGKVNVFTCTVNIL